MFFYVRASLLDNSEETTFTGFNALTVEVKGVDTAVPVLKCGMKTYMSLSDCPVITRSNLLWIVDPLTLNN